VVVGEVVAVEVARVVRRVVEEAVAVAHQDLVPTSQLFRRRCRQECMALYVGRGVVVVVAMALVAAVAVDEGAAVAVVAGEALGVEDP